ncbi:hypothetical protein RF55_26026 [Lasius niger]|uniref:Uncharacterized protein n=1 Tax=Lasius niger TaxID=67767 RepID=A0A0J7JUK8_LASNI|nr:hypothetical protein RF55_26026 [Lasius niger]
MPPTLRPNQEPPGPLTTTPDQAETRSIPQSLSPRQDPPTLSLEQEIRPLLHSTKQGAAEPLTLTPAEAQKEQEQPVSIEGLSEQPVQVKPKRSEADLRRSTRPSKPPDRWTYETF